MLFPHLSIMYLTRKLKIQLQLLHHDKDKTNLIHYAQFIYYLSIILLTPACHKYNLKPSTVACTMCTSGWCWLISCWYSVFFSWGCVVMAACLLWDNMDTKNLLQKQRNVDKLVIIIQNIICIITIDPIICIHVRHKPNPCLGVSLSFFYAYFFLQQCIHFFNKWRVIFEWLRKCLTDWIYCYLTLSGWLLPDYFVIDKISTMGSLWNSEVKFKKCGTTNVVACYHKLIYKFFWQHECCSLLFMLLWSNFFLEY